MSLFQTRLPVFLLQCTTFFQNLQATKIDTWLSENIEKYIILLKVDLK